MSILIWIFVVLLIVVWLGGAIFFFALLILLGLWTAGCFLKLWAGRFGW